MEDPLSPDEFNLEKAERMHHALRQLVASDGWKEYIAIMAQHQKVRLDMIVLAPLSGVDAAFEQEYKKGEIAGISLALSFPQTVIESLDTALAEARSQRDETKGDEP